MAMKTFESACALVPEETVRALSADHPADRIAIFWHRELPPLDAVVLDDHFVEATSMRVAGTLAHRDELWTQCYEDLMEQARVRLRQEVERLGGRYAHVLEESIDSRHNDATGEAWLSGRFHYTLLK
jgi:hypothetical protein